MVNEGLWESVQKQYPIEVQKKSNDEDDGLEERNLQTIIIYAPELESTNEFL